MEADWVDFKQIKSAVSMEMVLGHYNIKLRRVNQESLRGKCPLPTHTSHQEQSFGVHTSKNVWACQSNSCAKARGGKRGGNILDFVAAMESCSIRDAACKIQNWFSVPSVSASDTSPEVSDRTELVSSKEVSTSDEQNPKLAFTLKEVNGAHPYLASRGIEKETATAFGCGFFPGKGSMAGRVVIPIHNQVGELLAYAGRAIDETEPRYKLPSGFRKTLELFNLHRARAHAAEHPVIVVEGFFDAMKVDQAGHHCVVALMGSSISEQQVRMLIDNFSKVVVMLDADKQGREAAKEVAAKLIEKMFIKVINLADHTDQVQPDQLSSEEIKSLLEGL